MIKFIQIFRAAFFTSTFSLLIQILFVKKTRSSFANFFCIAEYFSRRMRCRQACPISGFFPIRFYDLGCIFSAHKNNIRKSLKKSVRCWLWVHVAAVSNTCLIFQTFSNFFVYVENLQPNSENSGWKETGNWTGLEAGVCVCIFAASKCEIQRLLACHANVHRRPCIPKIGFCEIRNYKITCCYLSTHTDTNTHAETARPRQPVKPARCILEKRRV